MRVSVAADIDGAKKALAGLEEYTKYLHRDILRAVAAGATKQVKSEFPFKKRSGELYRKTAYHMTRDRKAVMITNDATSAAGVRYGWVLAAGADIRPKHGKALKFADGTFSKRALIPRHAWIVPPAQRFVESPAREAAVQKAIDKALARLEKKGIIVRN